jgi:hypothetical protein
MNKIIEEIFRNYYVPLYPKDKPISEMTQYEQGCYKQLLVLGPMFLSAFIKKMKDIEPEFAQIINDNFWELI